MFPALTAVAQSVAAEWAVFDFAGLQFWRRDTGRLALLAVAGIATTSESMPTRPAAAALLFT